MRKYNRYNIGLAVLLGLLLLTTSIALVLDNVHTFRGRYVPLFFSMNPVLVDIGDVNADDIIVYNLTLGNPNTKNLSVTWVANTPAYIGASIIGWNQIEPRTLIAGDNMTIQVRMVVGLPAQANSTQTFSGTIQFIATKIP